MEKIEDLVGTLRDEYDLVANMTKSCVLGHDRAMTGLLQERITQLKLPVAHAFKDLGVAQGRSQESRVIRQKRWSNAIQRMARIGRLAVDFAGRGKFLASSALAAGAYGASVGPTAATTAAWLRRWAVHAVWRGGRNVHAGLLFTTRHLHWRADPTGHLAVRAWFFIWEILSTGTKDLEQLRMAWHQTSERAWGPLAAARQALQLCDIEGGLGHWAYNDEAGCDRVLRQPMHQTVQVWRAWLLQALAAKSTKAAGRSRPHVGMTGVYFDWEAIQRVNRQLRLAPSTAAALRGAQVGDVVVQQQAKYWHPGDDGTCPYCRGEVEDERHRWFRCPAWSAARVSLGFNAVATQLEHQMPQAMATWGLPVIPHELAQWHLARQTKTSDLAAPSDLIKAKIVCTDGSGMHPKDPMLRTVAWGLAWHDGHTWQTASGTVPGTQTVPRSEAAAILAALQGMQEGCDLWSDCWVVVEAVRAVMLQGDINSVMDKSPLADLLRQMIPHLRRLGTSVTVHWMRSHGTCVQAVEQGVPELAWVGNEKADQAAKLEALRHAPSDSICKQRALHQNLHTQVCRLIAGVQEMHMHHVRNVADTRGPAGQPAFPRKRKRAKPSAMEREPKRRLTGPRIAREAWEAGAPDRGHDADLLVHDFVQHQAARVLTQGELFGLLWNSPGDGREGLHTLQVVHGPASKPGMGVRPNGTVDIALACTTCEAKASNTGRWAALAKSQCGPARPMWRWTKHPHAYMPDVQGRTCIHCGLRIPGDRGAHARIGACPAERLHDGEEEVFEGTILLRGVLGLRACWLAWARGPSEPRDGDSGQTPRQLRQALPPPPPLSWEVIASICPSWSVPTFSASGVAAFRGASGTGSCCAWTEFAARSWTPSPPVWSLASRPSPCSTRFALWVNRTGSCGGPSLRTAALRPRFGGRMLCRLTATTRLG